MTYKTFMRAIMSGVIINAFSSANAAEISPETPDEMQCYITLQGPIEPGDVDLIRSALMNFLTDHPEDSTLFYPNSMNSWRKVCFDSPGGSFEEGVEIAQYLHEERIGSAVASGAQCLSACAVAFMGGTNDTRGDGGTIPFRQLHPLGKLGFHSPFIEVPVRNYTSQIVQLAFEGALSNIALLLERADEMHIQRSLVIEMLATPSNEFSYIETVGDASRWGIAIAPVPARDTLEPASVVNACYNQEAFILDKPQNIFFDASDVIMQTESTRMLGMLSDGFRGELSAPCQITQGQVVLSRLRSGLSVVNRRVKRDQIAA